MPVHTTAGSAARIPTTTASRRTRGPQPTTAATADPAAGEGSGRASVCSSAHEFAEAAMRKLEIQDNLARELVDCMICYNKHLHLPPPRPPPPGPERPKPPESTQSFVDNNSGLHIKKVSAPLLNIADHSANIRFVRISAFQNLAGGDSFSGCWASAGVVLDKGAMRVRVQ